MIMKPGCMTNPFYEYVPGQSNLPEAIRLLHEAGFDVIDLNMCPMQRNQMELCEDDIWERVTDEIGNTVAKYGMTFAQSHPPYPKAAVRRKTVYDEGCEYNAFFLKMMKRALEIDARLGIPWAVMHPISNKTGVDVDVEAEAAYNYEYYAPLMEIGAARGVGFAFENICDVDGRRRFGVTPAELRSIVDLFGDAKVGICWDTGHGNRMYADQLPFIKKVADKLVCMHIDDNVGEKDLHQLPYMGTVKWKELMALLKETNYPGAFIYEVALFSRLPKELKMPLAVYSREVAEYLISL